MNFTFLFTIARISITCLFLSLLFKQPVIATNCKYPKTKLGENIFIKKCIEVDSNLVLHIEKVDLKSLLRVSFNGNEGNDGKLKIYDQSNNLLIQSNFELIKSPFYATVDISALLPGIYPVSLNTKYGIHHLTLTID